MIYQGFSRFKQTFVLDLQGGVDIMRPFEMMRGQPVTVRQFSPYKKIPVEP
jgi:hypothetical protein